MNALHPIERIASKIVVDGNGCWIWTASKNVHGYGQVGFKGGVVRTHRLMYEHHVGPIGEGLEIDHLCKVKACCNPAHLEAVTHAENMRRSGWFEREAERKKARAHCKRGHPFDDVTTYNGTRYCRECKRLRKRGAL